MKYTAAALLLLALLTGTLTGCQKYTLDKDTDYTFSNSLNESVTVNIYQNKADYNNATNVWKQLILPAQGQQTLTMEIGKKYYVDWYNADGTYTNWTASNSTLASPAPELSIAAVPHTVALTAYPTDTRRLLLPGNSTVSNWKIIGIYTGGTQLNPAPYTLITFNKDLTTTVRYSTGAGDTTTIAGTYFNSGGSQINYMSVYLYSNITGQQLGQCTYEPSYPYPPTSTDTLSCTLNMFSNSYPYVMVRQ